MRTALTTIVLFWFATTSQLAEGAAPAPPESGPRVESRVVLPTKNEQGRYQRQLASNGFTARIDLGSQVIGLDIPKDESWRSPEEKVRPGDTVVIGRGGAPLMMGRRRIASLAAGQLLGVSKVEGDKIAVSALVDGQMKYGWIQSSQAQFKSEAPMLHPTLAELTTGEFASAATLAQKAKQFDDGLYAAVELAAQNGAGAFGGKGALLQSLAADLTKGQPKGSDGAINTLLAAAVVGDPRTTIPANFKAITQSVVASFQANALWSKPIGFYPWSPELQQIFRQDRMLQSELQGRAAISAIIERLRADATSRATYEKYLQLVSRLTNPIVQPDLRKLIDDRGAPMPESGVYFFPPSRSHETDLVKRLFADRPVPEGFNLADELVARVHSGGIKLEPREDSGWYDYQTWSLEPLILPETCPEAPQLALSKTYRDHLRELFKGLLALTRETHIKQTEIAPTAEAAPMEEPRPEFYIRPELSAEPLAEVYRRRAASYRFVRGVLEETFGAAALAGMHRLTATGPVSVPLADELAQIEGLFLGAAVVVSRQLGVDLKDEKLGAGADADARQFLNWSANLPLDADVGQDARMMVPVFYDLARKKTKVWVFMGWSAKGLIVSFARQPKVTVTNAAGEPLDAAKFDAHFQPTYLSLPSPIVAEVYVSDLLDREQFRTHCDAYRTSEAILANLK